MKYELLHADCRAVLSNMADDSVDSICTDPPYHLTSIVKRFGPGQFGSDGAFARASRGFMGQVWDGGDIAFDRALWAECLRVLKPGGHLLAFSGTRTYHRMACAIDDAGFEIRDMISWLYGSGFPKSHDVAKALKLNEPCPYCGPGILTGLPGNACENCMNTGLAHPEAQEWDGWGTALKPACEPICFARKPLIGTVAANVLAHRTGAINIDGCRVPATGRPLRASLATLKSNGIYGSQAIGETGLGRFPANVVHDGSDEVLAGFPAQAGAAAPVHRRGGDKFRSTYGTFAGNIDEAGSTFRGDSGSAARFFYCAKASKADREVGCESLVTGYEHSGPRGHRLNGDGSPRAASLPRGNIHPTVKPTELMRWLVRLVTPLGGLVFDPFTGSGSTGRAAILEGCRFVGAEMTAEYIPIARARIDAAVNGK